MKFLHISDLHLGIRLKEMSLIEDQAYILKELIGIIDDTKPDGVLIAGDIYDRSVPSEEAVRLWDEFLVSLAGKGVPVYAISGNHDSAVRFADHGALVESAKIYLAPEYRGEAKHIRLKDSYGWLNIYMLPFIKPSTIRSVYQDMEVNDYTEALRVAIDKMNVDTSERNILIAHQFVYGASTCDSEVVVGGLDSVSVDVFDSFDYVALGHLHGKQHVGRETVRYCGTPLKYSLSEKNHQKSVTVIDFGDKGDVKISEILLKPKRDLREIRGEFDTLTDQAFYDQQEKEDYIYVVLTDENEVPEAMSRLRLIYPYIVGMKYDNTRTRAQQLITNVENVEKKSPIELFEEFYEMQNSQPMSDEQREFVNECINSIWHV